MKSVVVAILCAAAPAFAEPIAVKVTEVAGGVAYLAPGRAAGIVAGTKVQIRGRSFSVFETTEKTCAIRSDRLAPGDTGTANVDRAAAPRVERLPAPRPSTMFDGQWPEAVKPAATQDPASVALGSGAPG